MVAGRSGDDVLRRAGPGACTALLAGLLASGAVAYVWRFSDFRADDLDHFLLLERVGLWPFLWTPIDVHHTPLHRLLSYGVHRVAPMSFAPAVVVMATLHAATLFTLYRTLRLAGTGGCADVAVCCYAASILGIYGMLWWAHAQHRMPYVLLDTFAVYHYLAWLKRGGRVHLAAVALGTLLAFGFYEKAALIPVHVLAVGVCAFPSSFRTRPLWSAAPACLLGALTAAFALARPHAGSEALRRPLAQVLSSEWAFGKMLASGVAGIPLGGGSDDAARLACIGILWGGLFGLCLWRSRAAAAIACVLVATLFVDYLPIALSNRVAVFGRLVLSQYRFHYEELHVVALFGGLTAARVFAGPALHPLRRRLAGVAVVVGFALVNLTGLHVARDEDRALRVHRVAHRYLANLREGLARIEEPEPRFANDRIPAALSVFGSITDTRTLVPLFLPSARFGEPATYTVDIRGRVRRTR